MTVLGGALMRPEVEAVNAMAGRHFVSIPDLESPPASASRKCSSCRRDTVPSSRPALRRNASGLAGILTHDNPKFIEQLPDLTGIESEVIIQKSHRNPFDHQLRSTGIKARSHRVA